MSNIEIGQVWKNDWGVELTIVAPWHHRQRVLSDDIWVAESRLSSFATHTYFVTEKSLADDGYKLTRSDH